MSREIKFRAWCKPDMGTSGIKEFMENKIEEIQLEPTEDDPQGEFIGEKGIWCGIHEAVLMQYTGLHDNTPWEELSENGKEKFLSDWNYSKDRQNKKEDWKGKEIYEGDIISFTHNKYIRDEENGLLGGAGKIEEYTRNYAVEFVNTYCTYGLRARNKSIHFMLSQATINTRNARVIGNIYDNPELLKEGTENANPAN